MNCKSLLILTLLTAGCAAQDILAPQANNFLAQQTAEATREEQIYAEATNLLNNNQWERAAERFNDVATMKGRRADAGLYWKAYSLNKMGRRADALTTIGELRRQYPRSTWLKDAGAMEIEIRQASGQQVNPEKEPDEDIKLIAIQGLMNTDSERALPILQKLLTSPTSSIRVKERALFVLSQSDSPQAAQIIASVARGQQYPDLQRKAINYLGVNGGGRNAALLSEIYQSATSAEIKRAVLNSFMIAGEKARLLAATKAEQDPHVRRFGINQLGVMGATSELKQVLQTSSAPEERRAILNAFMVAGDKEDLLAAMKTERDPEVRRFGINQLGVMGATRELKEIFQSSTSLEDKSAIINAFGVAGDSDDLMEIVKSNADPEIRKKALRALGITGGNLAPLVQIAASDPDRDTRRAAMEALFIRGDAHDLVAIAKSTSDPETRKRAVEKLSLMDSKEARDYMLELLNK